MFNFLLIWVYFQFSPKIVLSIFSSPLRYICLCSIFSWDVRIYLFWVLSLDISTYVQFSPEGIYFEFSPYIVQSIFRSLLRHVYLFSILSFDRSMYFHLSSQMRIFFIALKLGYMQSNVSWVTLISILFYQVKCKNHKFSIFLTLPHNTLFYPNIRFRTSFISSGKILGTFVNKNALRLSLVLPIVQSSREVD